MIPLILRLKKTAHREIAKAQDILIEALYTVFPKAVLHGGTAIWRCYQGNRFSEDIDVYLPRDLQKIDRLYKAFQQKGFSIEKKKIGENSIYSTLKLNTTLVRFEALFKKIKGSLKEYEKTEGNFITIYTLTPEELITEKIATYMKRLKIRDLYDIFFLLRYVPHTTHLITDLQKLLHNFKEPPDEKELKILITEGIIPSVEDMLAYIQRRKHG